MCLITLNTITNVQGQPLGIEIKWRPGLTRCFDKSTKNWCSVASWVVEVYAWFTIWNFFDLMWPQRPLSERVPYISEKLDFWWSVPQKITSNGYFGANDDQTIRIRRFFWGMDHRNTDFSLIYSTLSDGGRWGHMKSKKFQMVDQA